MSQSGAASGVDPSTPSAQPSSTTPAAVTEPSGIAQVVSNEFPTYDKNSDGALNKAEFSAWMVALKTASDPNAKAASAETKTWVNGAFTSADTDKSKSVSKEELTGFLTKAQG